MKPRAPRAGSLAIAILGLALVGYLTWDQRAAMAFFVGSGAPVDLGAPGGYRLDAARDNAFARVEGTPGGARNRFERFGVRYEIVALRGTNILVRRSEPAAEDRKGLIAQGRLVADTSIPEYGQAFAFQVEQGAAQPVDGRLFVLLDGERPWSGWRTPALLAALLVLALFNGATLVRWLRARAGRTAASARVDEGGR